MKQPSPEDLEMAAQMIVDLCDKPLSGFEKLSAQALVRWAKQLRQRQAQAKKKKCGFREAK